MTPKGGIIPHNRYRIPAKRAEVLFVDYIAEHLNPTGKAGIIVPEGIVFQSANAYKSLRKYLVEDGLLYAVISLPAGVFNPYSGVKTSILLIDKTLSKQKDEILFVKINNDGYDLGAQRREVKGSDIPEVIKIIKAYQNGMYVSDNALVTIASKKNIAEQDYILVGERYKAATDISTNFPMVELGDILDYEQPTNYIVESVDYNESYEIPVLTAGQSFILGYTNETTGIFKDNLPVIIFDDFTTASKFVDFPFKVKSSAMKILKPRDGVNLKYVYYTMKNIQFNSEIHKRYWISEYSKVRIPLPPLHIQEEIVKEIDGYQKIIDGAKQVVENYKPTIKIDQSWEMTRIDDVVEFVSGVTLAVKDCEDPNGLPLITIADVSEDGYLKLDNIRTVNTTKNVNILKKGDLLFNWRNGSKHLVGKTALFDLDGDYIFASFLLGIRPNQKIVKSKFMWLLLNQYRSEGKYLQFMRQNVNGLFNREELKEVLIPVPSIETQQTVIARIQEEMAIIEQNKRLIELFEQKIKDKISEVWGE
jgi:type I restriction enzyme M protein